MRDIVSKAGTIKAAIAPTALTAGITGTDINTAGYNGAMFYVAVVSFASGSHAFLIEEADDNAGVAGSYTTVANADLIAWKGTTTTDGTPVKVGGAQITTITNAATAVSWRVGYIGGKQWIRISSTASGSAVYAVVCLLGEPRNLPAAV